MAATVVVWVVAVMVVVKVVMVSANMVELTVGCDTLVHAVAMLEETAAAVRMVMAVEVRADYREELRGLAMVEATAVEGMVAAVVMIICTASAHQHSRTTTCST